MVAKEVAMGQILRLRRHQQTFPPLLHCLHTLTQNLPTAPLGRKVSFSSFISIALSLPLFLQLHDVYLLCMEKHVMMHGTFEKAWNLVK